jgi:4-coumarate--CoA ligase
MPFLTQDRREFPTMDLLSWYFDDQRFDENEPIYIDAADTRNYYSHKQAKEGIRKIAAGLRAIGIKKGDTVCIHSFNSVCKVLRYKWESNAAH